MLAITRRGEVPTLPAGRDVAAQGINCRLPRRRCLQKPFICFSDRSIYAYTFNGWRLPNGTLPIRHCPKKGRLMDKLYYGNCRAGRAAGPADFT